MVARAPLVRSTVGVTVRRGIVLCSIYTLMLVSVPDALAQPRDENCRPLTGSTPRSILDRNLTARRAHGLRTDLYWVRRILRSPYAICPYDSEVAVTRGERRFLDAQSDLQQRTRRIALEYIQTRAPDTHALFYFYGGSVIVGFTEDLDSHLEKLRRIVPDPRRVGVFQARFSARELREVQDGIRSQQLQTLGLDVRAIFIDYRQNLVALEVVDPPPEAEETVEELYGPAVRVRAITEEEAPRVLAASKTDPLAVRGPVK